MAMSNEEKKVKKAAKPKKIKPGKIARRDAIAGVCFVLPWVIGLIVFKIVPLINSFQYSLARIKFTARGMKVDYKGFDNFVTMFTEDAEFPVQIVSYVTQTLITAPIIVVFALIIAMFLNGKIRCRGLFRSIYFLPVIIASGPVMNMLVGQGATTIATIDSETITNALAAIMPEGFEGVTDAVADVFGNIITILWYSGVQILIFLSALQKIDSSLYEAAGIDGGSGWECFWKITLPTIKPMIVLNVVYTIIFRSNNEQNQVIVMIKDAMKGSATAKTSGYGYASAMAWVFSVIEVLIIGIMALLLMTRKDVYEKQIKRQKKLDKKEARAIRRVRRRDARNAKRKKAA